MGLQLISRTLRESWIAAALLVSLVSLPRGTQAGDEAPENAFRATSRRSFAAVEQWTKVFDDPKRDDWQKPDEVVAFLGIAPGATVADLGAGTGYFSRRLSEAVGPKGSVLAIDTEPELVLHLRDRAEREATTNLTPILASQSNPRIPNGTADLIIVVDTFHHIDARLEYLRQLNTALRPGGRVAVIDWKKEELPVGPPVDHKLSREQVVYEMRAAGYQLVEENKTLPYQYFLVFEPLPSSPH